MLILLSGVDNGYYALRAKKRLRVQGNGRSPHSSHIIISNAELVRTNIPYSLSYFDIVFNSMKLKWFFFLGGGRVRRPRSRDSKS